MFKAILLFVPQVILMAYMCLLQFLPRSAKRFFPFGQYSLLSAKSGLNMDLSNRVAVVTGANSGVGLVTPKADTISALCCVMNPPGLPLQSP
jgi:hypothetical protein